MLTDIIYNIQAYIQLQRWIKEICYIFLCAHTHTHKIVAVFNHKYQNDVIWKKMGHHNKQNVPYSERQGQQT